MCVGRKKAVAKDVVAVAIGQNNMEYVAAGIIVSTVSLSYSTHACGGIT